LPGAALSFTAPHVAIQPASSGPFWWSLLHNTKKNLIPESWPAYFAGKCRSEFSMALEKNARHFPPQRIDPIGTMKGKFGVYQS
jgi:hypothetical protein